MNIMRPIFLLILLTFFGLHEKNVLAQAQRASAEFISSITPMSLSTGEKVKDGIRSVLFHDQKLYVTNIWTGIQIVNVSDLRNPVPLGSFETEHRPHNIYVENDYGYISPR